MNIPYSAQRRFTSIDKVADGKLSRSESGGNEARDSQGRTYTAGERKWTYMEGNKSILKSEMLYRIHDPVANTDTRWDSSLKETKVIHWSQKMSNDDSQCHAECLESATNTLFDAVEKLGVKTIEGFVAEGTRRSYTVPAGLDHNSQPILVVHEVWYSPELKLVILETNDDPRSGTTRNELIQIVRGEPDVSQYQPPRATSFMNCDCRSVITQPRQPRPRHDPDR
ncbi:hypothetical protein [Acidicapsa acidisoli]|uniref:hypothetical protein n=1 Tax=Acidicapsa acidisoli TaxID=1615681 RepID=UPI0021E03B23|nr:hypothetical protein [Acidicapsa acidisoli]